jgi:uncharacterized membrane protein
MAVVREWLVIASEYVVVVINTMALIVVAYATIEAFVKAARLAFGYYPIEKKRAVWLRYSRWLVAALTFQLAADIVETAISTDWNSLGRIAVIAVIRTFLNYFLEKDVADLDERESNATG